MERAGHVRLTQEGHRCTGALVSAVWYLLGAAAFSLGGSGREPDCARLLLDPLLLQLPAPAPTYATPAVDLYGRMAFPLLLLLHGTPVARHEVAPGAKGALATAAGLMGAAMR